MLAKRLVALLPAVAVLAAAAAPVPVTPTALTPTVVAPTEIASTVVTTTVAAGTATTRSVPLSVTTLGIPVQVGVLELMATTVPTAGVVGPLATTDVTLLDIGGARFGELGVRSDGATSNDGVSLSQLTAIGPVDVVVAELLAIADAAAGTAVASLGSLNIDATVLGLLGLDLDVVGALANVGNDEASASHTLLLSQVNVSLDMLLGTVLDGLPLDTLLDLAGQLGVEVPVNLTDVGALVVAIEGFLASVSDVQDAANPLIAASDALVAAVAVDPLAGYDVAAVQALADTLTALNVAGDPVGSLAALVGVLANDSFIALDCGLAAPTLLTLTAGVADAQSCVGAQLAAFDAAVLQQTALAAALYDATDALYLLTTEMLLAGSQMESAAQTFGDLAGDVEELVGNLLDVDLLTIDAIGVQQDVIAVGGDLDGSSAQTTCSLTSISILAQDALPVTGCDATTAPLTGALSTLTGVLADVVDSVGGVGTSKELKLELFGVLEDEVTQAADGTVTASSLLEVLRLSVPTITVAPCEVLDGLVCELGVPLDLSVLDSLDGLGLTLDETLALVNQALVDGFNAISSSPVALGVFQPFTPATSDSGNAQFVPAGAVDAPFFLLEGFDNELSFLADTLDGILSDLALGLGLGTLGSAEGVTIPGTVIVVDPEVEASHVLRTVTTEVDPSTTEVDPTVEDAPPLPNTGGGAMTLAMFALAGGGLLMRRRNTGSMQDA